MSVGGQRKLEGKSKVQKIFPQNHPNIYFPNISLKPTKILFYQLSRSHRSNYSFFPNTCSIKRNTDVSSWFLWFQHFQTSKTCGFGKQGTPCSKMVSFLLKVISIMAAANSWCKNSHHSMICFLAHFKVDSLDSMPWSPATGKNQKKIHLPGDIHRYPPHPISTPLLLLRILEGSLEPCWHPRYIPCFVGGMKFFLDPVGPKSWDNFIFLTP